MPRNVQLLVIDPQNDFCDLPQAWWHRDPATGTPVAPALPVTGAHADLGRLAGFIRDHGDALSSITVTLDSHHRVDIAHPPFWQQGDGSAVAPFTSITAQQVRDGAFMPRDPTAHARALAYLDELEARGRYTLVVWPIHCEIGSWGHNVHAGLKGVLAEWEDRRLAPVRYLAKGDNPWTEHYSALQAEVPDPQDPRSQLNKSLLLRLGEADLLLVAGEASSHCVKATVEDIAEHLPGGSLERVVLLADCMSPVGGFEAQADGFLAAMQARGIKLASAGEAPALLG